MSLVLIWSSVIWPKFKQVPTLQIQIQALHISIYYKVIIQGGHSPDNVKSPDGSRHSSAALCMLSVTHIMPILMLLSVVGVGMQQCMIRNHIFNI